MTRTVFKNLRINGNMCDIVCESGKIADIGRFDAEGTDMGGRKVYPGLVDIHTHGIAGVDTMDADFEPLARAYAENGTTTFYPTAMTAPTEKLARVVSARLPAGGAKIAGFHLEGPYINPKRCGAQSAVYARNPKLSEFSGFDGAKLITLAPELEGALEYIKNTSMTVCVGHTSADYETVCRAAEAGAKCVTHLLNAMPVPHHRQPSVLGAAFDCGMYVQVICDGLHIHPSVIRMLYRLFGADRMILISDSMRAALLPDGEYELGGLPVTVKNKIARTSSGALAGSTSTLLDCVRCAVKFGIPEADAFKMASETPAAFMGLNCGSLQKGRDCDFIVLDDDNNLEAAVINGRTAGKWN